MSSVMSSKYVYGGVSDIGYGREINEDYLDFVSLSEDVLFGVVADGVGSKASAMQPAAIASSEITQAVYRLYTYDAAAFLASPRLMLLEAMHIANRVLAAFKVSNEELYSGFGVCVTCCLVYNGNKFCFAHAGNTRLYLIRNKDNVPTIRQLSKDHTKAAEMLDEEIITPEQFVLHPDRTIYTSGLGVFAEPKIQLFDGTLKEGDIILITTDGIHYAIRPEALSDITMQAGSWDAATRTLIEGAKMQKYVDNMTAAIIHLPISEQAQK